MLTDSSGTMYLVVTPCAKVEVNRIALKYVPPGSPPDGSSDDKVVVEYAINPPLEPAGVLAPLQPSEPPPEGFSLVQVDADLLAKAMNSKKGVRFDDYFYVEAAFRASDGTLGTLSGSWSADMSRLNTVTLGNQVFNDAAGRHCGPDDTGWAIP